MTRTWTKIAKANLSATTTATGSPIGLLLALTYSTNGSGAGTSWTKISKASGTSWTKIAKATGTTWTKISKAV